MLLLKTSSRLSIYPKICNLAIEFSFAQKKLLSLFACGDQGMHVHAWDSLTNYSFTMKKKKKEDGDDDDQGQGRA